MQVSDADGVDTLMAILEAETGIATSEQRLLHNGSALLAGCAAQIELLYQANSVSSKWAAAPPFVLR